MLIKTSQYTFCHNAMYYDWQTTFHLQMCSKCFKLLIINSFLKIFAMQQSFHFEHKFIDVLLLMSNYLITLNLKNKIKQNLSNMMYCRPPINKIMHSTRSAVLLTFNFYKFRDDWYRREMKLYINFVSNNNSIKLTCLFKKFKTKKSDSTTCVEY